MKRLFGHHLVGPIGALLATALLAASCGASVGSVAKGHDDGVTSTSVAAATTTAAPTTTSAAKPVTKAELEALLPSAADIGPDYKVDKSADADDGSDDDSGDSTMTAAIDKACPPGTSELLGSSDADNNGAETTATRSFATTDGRSAEVDLGPVDPKDTAAALEKVIANIKKCGPISFTAGGNHATMKISAERVDTIGDLAVSFDINLEIRSGQSSEAVPLEIRSLEFHRGSVDVTVEVESGVDPNTGLPVAGDFDVIDPLAKSLDAKVTDLQRH